MANDINKYPHTHYTDTDAVVIGLRDGTSPELVRSLHDVLEQLGSVAVERITADSNIRNEVETLLTEATRILQLLPHEDVRGMSEHDSHSLGIHLLHNRLEDETAI